MVDVVKADDVPVFLAALADLDDPVVAELLPRIAPRVHQGRPLAVRLAVRVGATDVLAELLGSAMTARSRGRTVETLVESRDARAGPRARGPRAGARRRAIGLSAPSRVP
ncbi:MAG: hypothetical protein H6736_03905 [Alphaproteobacteria bacterium]|nr:hypothetical protein [Alphaproteobacteria bacterium]